MKINEDKLRELKNKIYKSQETRIKKIYKDIAISINEELKNKDEDNMLDNDLDVIKRRIEEDIKNANKEIEAIIEGNIKKIIGSTLLVHKSFIKDIDKKYKTNFISLFEDKTNKLSEKVLKDIINGKIYSDKRKLSRRIWGYNKEIIKDINHIINTGIKNKTNVYLIAKDLEKYVNPYEKKTFEWKKVYPNSKLKVDYNAQRLARTSINHAYQDAYIESAKANPFIEYIEYNAAHNARVCSMCNLRDGKRYKVDDVPYDHPNGNCYLTSVIPDNLTDKIAELVNKMDL